MVDSVGVGAPGEMIMECDSEGHASMVMPVQSWIPRPLDPSPSPPSMAALPLGVSNENATPQHHDASQDPTLLDPGKEMVVILVVD